MHRLHPLPPAGLRHTAGPETPVGAGVPTCSTNSAVTNPGEPAG